MVMISERSKETKKGHGYSHLSKVLVKHFSAGTATMYRITKIAVTQQQLLCNEEQYWRVSWCCRAYIYGNKKINIKYGELQAQQ